MYLAAPPRCHVLLVDLESDDLRSALRHEAFWSRAGRQRRPVSDDAPDGPTASATDPLTQVRRTRATGAIIVARLRARNPSRLALVDDLGCFDHVAILPDSMLGNPGPTLTDQLSIPPDAVIAQLQPPPPPDATGFARAAFRAFRPHHWIKNLLVFVPLLAAHQVTPASLGNPLLAFAAFCAVASAIYVLNDVLDLGPDRQHARKRLRPFASNALPLRHAPVLIVVTLGVGLALAAAIGVQFAAILGIYIVASVAYSLGLKRVAIADIVVLSVLYTLRIVAGGIATDIALSVWLVAFALFLFLALAAIKRQAELAETAPLPQARVPGRGYRRDDLPLVTMLAVAAGHMAVLVLALYVNSADVRVLYPNPQWLWLACLALYFWTMRLVLFAHRGLILDDPVVHAARDPASWACAAVMACAVICASIGQTGLA